MDETKVQRQHGVITSPWFGPVLACVVALTFATLALWVALAVAIQEPTGAEASLIEGVSRSFAACLGAILGLLGGKVS